MANFLPLIISFAITVMSIPLTIKLAQKYRLLDDPKLRLHPAHAHKRVIPRAGGLPIYLGIVLSILLLVPLTKSIIGILLGISLLLIVGLLDDFWLDFSPYPRLVLQFLAAGIVVASGVGINYITNPTGGIIRLDEIVFPFQFLGDHTVVLIADLFAFFWIAWMMNMVNWSKGVDGQMPGIVAVAALIIAALSSNLAVRGDYNQQLIANLSLITAGASLGFLIFNWYPSKILPGFSASTILGFMIATLSILSGAKLATALLVLLIPSVDFFYTFLRRVVSGSNPFRADQKHLHHLLLQRGWSHPKISLFYISSCAILGLTAINLSSQGKLFTVIGVGVVSLGTIIWLHLFGHSLGPPGPDNG